MKTYEITYKYHNKVFIKNIQAMTRSQGIGKFFACTSSEAKIIMVRRTK
jgi:hypothetical protein